VVNSTKVARMPRLKRRPPRTPQVNLFGDPIGEMPSSPPNEIIPLDFEKYPILMLTMSYLKINLNGGWGRVSVKLERSNERTLSANRSGDEFGLQ
jgi:hypothetical protein